MAALLATVRGPLRRVVGRAADDIESFARRIPARLTDFVGVEVRLDAPNDGADLLAYITRADPLRRPDVRRALAPAGSELGRLADALRSAPPGLREPLAHGWIEWDLSLGPADRASVFAAPGVADASAPHAAGCIHAMLSGSTSTGIADACERLARALPPGTQTMQVGVMAPPRTLACRVVVSGAGIVETVAAAGGAGWAGRLAEIERLASRLDIGAVETAVGFDIVEDGLLPSVGVEINCPVQERQRALIRALAREGLIADAATEALWEWPLMIRRGSPTAPWPARLARLEELYGHGVATGVQASVHHVKITVRPDRPPRAKAYLAVRERRRGTLAARRSSEGAAEIP